MQRISCSGQETVPRGWFQVVSQRPPSLSAEKESTQDYGRDLHLRDEPENVYPSVVSSVVSSEIELLKQPVWSNLFLHHDDVIREPIAYREKDFGNG